MIILNSMLMRETDGRSMNLETKLDVALLSTSLPAPLIYTVKEHLTREITFRSMLYKLPWAEYKHPS